MDHQTKTIIKYLIFPLVLLITVVYIALAQTKPDFLLHAYIYDLKSSKSALIETYAGQKILIDGGPTNEILKDIGQDLPFYDHKIDTIILTTPDTAHVSGLIDVVKRYEVRQVILNQATKYNGSYDEFVTLVGDKRIPVTYLKPAERIWFDRSTVLDVGSIGNQFSGQITFGQTHIELPLKDSGDFVSDSKTLYKK
jgi:beta-lactamase superfamily II metal-dependent hydrolase